MFVNVSRRCTMVTTEHRVCIQSSLTDDIYVRIYYIMCFNASASMISFITGTLSSLVLFYYNKPLAVFLLFVTFMQVFDYIFWQNQEKNRMNAITTKVAMIFNHLQPIVLALSLIYFGKTLPPLSIFFITLYTIIISLYTYIHWNKVDYTLVTPQSSPGLFWQWNYQEYRYVTYFIYLCTIIVLLLQNIEYPLNIIIVLFTVGTFIFSYFSHLKIKSVGRMWCHYSGFIPVFIALYYVFPKSKPSSSRIKRRLHAR
jgi:hypothetical protein